MQLSDKIIHLRKSKGMSQEALAEKLNLSRQAISRWERGTAMPDAANILQLSKLFGVTADYLLHDDYESDNDLPKIKEIKKGNYSQIMAYLVLLEIMIVLLQFMSTVILQNMFFGLLSFIPFLALIGGFEYAQRKHASQANEMTFCFRKRFYKISAWLGLYFPLRFLTTILTTLFTLPLAPPIVFECIVLSIYLGTSTCVSLSIEKNILQG